MSDAKVKVITSFLKTVYDIGFVAGLGQSGTGEHKKALELSTVARKALDAYIDGLESQRDDLLALMEAVEWVEDWPYHLHRCAWCKWASSEGHAPDCPRQAAITRVKGEESGSPGLFPTHRKEEEQA